MSILQSNVDYHGDQRDLNIGFQSSNGGSYSGGIGMYIGNEKGQIAMGTSPQVADAYFAEKFYASHTRVNVVVDTVENGFIMTINEKKFVCTEPKELGDMLIAHMVAQRVSK
jgi:hypothetical protein